MRSMECGVYELAPILNSALRTPHSALDCLDNLFGRPVQSLQPIRPHEHPPQLHRLDHRAHGDERRDELGELLVVMHRVGLAQLQRGTEADRLAHSHARIHARAPGERPDLPEPAGVVGGKQGDGERRELGPPRELGAQREQRDPAAGSGIARKTGCPGHVPGQTMRPEYIPKIEQMARLRSLDISY